MPVVLLMGLRQIKQGDVQVTVLEHVPPQVAVVREAVRSWRTESALAERTAINVVANKIFFSMFVLLLRPTYFSGAGGGPSGWQTPVVLPLNRPKQKQGRLQMSELVQGLPQATTACGVVPSWRTDSALADKTARNIAANNAFFAMDRGSFCLIYFIGEGAGPSGWQVPVVPPPRPK
jgi:hypothetical protein